jgi:hypothetical protein
MLRKFLIILSIFVTSLVLVACDENGELDENFDPTPYLGEAFQRVANYEGVMIAPQSAKWIYADDDTSNLSILYLFTAFGRSGSTGTFYAMVTIYVNKDTESLEAAFIDRIYYDELGASQSSAQAYQILYVNMLAQMQAIENRLVEEGVFTSEVIASAMQYVTAPSAS